MNKYRVKKGQLLEERKTEKDKSSVYLYKGDVYRISEPSEGRGNTYLLVEDVIHHFSDALIFLSREGMKVLQNALGINLF